MAYTSALNTEDRDWIDTEISEIVRDRASIRTGEVTQDLIAKLETVASSGSPQDAVTASRVLRSLAFDGVRRLVETAIKREQGTVRLSGTGRVVSVPARVGSRVRDEDGVSLKVFQQTLWYEMTWDDFVAMIASRLHHIAQLSDKVAAFQEVLRYRDQFPETRTPGEALERAGIDPQSIAFEEAA
jgi:hypothetical protein